MRSISLIVVLVGVMALSSCVSGRPKTDTYKDRDGVVQVIENERESCVHACNSAFDRCGDTDAARRASIDSTQGIFGASAGCNKSLANCLGGCKGR
ncbi:MAG: hypothetical protein PHX43_05045 [Alphaproteobacteria bacterium]|nr:hypothetical protein [Alphaproteobacteria bacterium]